MRAPVPGQTILPIYYSRFQRPYRPLPPVLASFAALPKFAEGGIAYGPTVGLFGEYPGAANNPEVVAPLNKLQSLIEPAWSGMPDSLTTRVSGRDLEIILRKQNRFKSRI